MCHADLRRETATIIARPVPALLYDTTAWYPGMVPGLDAWMCGCVDVCVFGRVRDAMDLDYKTFPTKKSD